MRMPTLLPFGEGRVSGEAIDKSTHSIRRGSWRGTSERWLYELVPKPARFAALVNRNFPLIEAIVKDLHVWAARLGLE